MSSNGNIFCVTGPLREESTGHLWIPSQRPMTRSFDVFFDLCLNKLLSKQSKCRWFEIPSRSLWRHCYALNGHEWFLCGFIGNKLKANLFKMSASLLGQLRPGWAGCPFMKCWQPYYLKSQSAESFMRNHCCHSFHSVACCLPAAFRMRIMNGQTGFSRFKQGIQLNSQLSKPQETWFNTMITYYQ